MIDAKPIGDRLMASARLRGRWMQHFDREDTAELVATWIRNHAERRDFVVSRSGLDVEVNHVPDV